MTFEEWKKQYRVQMPNDLKAKVYQVLDEHSSGTFAIRKKRKTPLTWMRSVAAVVAACLVVAGGVYTYSIHNASFPNQGVQLGKNHPGENVGGIAWGIPSNIAWNGYYYATKGYINTIGSKLGVAMYPGAARIYSVRGKNPDQSIAVEVDTPNGKYVSAVRVPVGTISSPIPSNWMSINMPKYLQPIHPGEALTISGQVFFRELYGSTIQVGLLDRKHHKGVGYLSTQEFQVAENGTVGGKFLIPKHLSVDPSAPENSQFLLVFREVSKNHPTTPFDYAINVR